MTITEIALRLLLLIIGVSVYYIEDNKSDHKLGNMRPWPTLVAIELIIAGVFGF